MKINYKFPHDFLFGGRTKAEAWKFWLFYTWDSWSDTKGIRILGLQFAVDKKPMEWW